MGNKINPNESERLESSIKLEDILCENGGKASVDTGRGFYNYCPFMRKSDSYSVMCPYLGNFIPDDTVKGGGRYYCSNYMKQPVMIQYSYYSDE